MLRFSGFRARHTGPPAIGLAALTLLIAVPTAALAQEDAGEPDRWAFTVDVGFNGARGNSSYGLLTAGLGLTRTHTEVFEFDWSARVRYGQSSGVEIARSIRSGVKFDLYPHSTWSPFLFVNAQNDPLRRLDLRTYSGIGAKYTFLQRMTGKASISLAALYARDEYTPDPLFPAQQLETEQDARWSWRVKGEKGFGQSVYVESSVFYQPVWDDPADFYIDASTSFNVVLGQKFSLYIQHNYFYDATPQEHVSDTDEELTTGLRFRF